MNDPKCKMKYLPAGSLLAVFFLQYKQNLFQMAQK